MPTAVRFRDEATFFRTEYLQKVILAKIIACYCFTQKASFRSNGTLYHPIALRSFSYMSSHDQIITCTVIHQLRHTYLNNAWYKFKSGISECIISINESTQQRIFVNWSLCCVVHDQVVIWFCRNLHVYPIQ